MLPREHGAYGQLLFPLVTALAIGDPGWRAFSIAAVAVCLFLAHEPALVLLGQRGPRAAREDRARAFRWLALPAVGAIGLAVPLVLESPASVRLALMVPATCAAVLFGVIVAGREHTLAGETVSALAFASTSLPAGIAGGAGPAAAAACASTFAVAFVSATLAVHAVIGYTRHPPAIAGRVVAATVAVLSALVFVAIELVWRGALSALAPWPVLPPCAVSCVLAAAPPSARRLRIVGWTIFGSTLASSIVLVSVLRS